MGGLMTKFEDWPLWLQLLVGVPHAILGGVLAWVWTPTRRKGWYWAVGLFLYLSLFYAVFVRK
jgi:CHASE2 domain-containing sensor protein